MRLGLALLPDAELPRAEKAEGEVQDGSAAVDMVTYPPLDPGGGKLLGIADRYQRDDARRRRQALELEERTPENGFLKDSRMSLSNMS